MLKWLGEGREVRASCSRDDQCRLANGSRLIKNVFQKALQRSPVIIFTDEIDAMGSSRDTGRTSDSWLLQIKSELLSRMDGVGSENDDVLVQEQRTCLESSTQYSVDDFKGVFTLVCRTRRLDRIYWKLVSAMSPQSWHQ